MSREYCELASHIIQEVGGKANVVRVIHCVTRLRFTLKDESLASDETLMAMDGVVTVVKAQGQYMVVIGQHVADVYDEVCDQLGLAKQDALDENLDVEPVKKSPLEFGIGLMSAAMGPALNLMCASGIIKGLLVILVMLGLPMDSGVYQLLNTAGDAVFLSMPAFLGYGAAQYLKIDPFFGMLIGLTLTYPAIQGVELNVFGMTVSASYTSTFLPILFGALAAAPLYKLLHSHISPLLRDIVTPIVTLVIIFPLTFCLLGPAANVLGFGINAALSFLFERVPLVACLVFGAVYPIMVMFGVHGTLMMFAFADLMSGNPSLIMAVAAGMSFAATGVLFAAMMRTKDPTAKSQAASSGISSFMGITEPGLYGIIVPQKALLAITCIGGAIGGLVAGLFRVRMHAYSGLGIMSLIGLVDPTSPQIIPVLLVGFVPMVATFALSMLFFKNEGAQ